MCVCATDSDTFPTAVEPKGSTPRKLFFLGGNIKNPGVGGWSLTGGN